MKVIFTCGGTAGHINPAIAVANILKERLPDCRILFIGAKGCMEERLVPQAGYDLKCVQISGLPRKINLEGIKKGFKAVKNVFTATSECKKIIRDFGPDVIVGTGGYASFPALYAGSKLGIPTCVHESNAVPGLTTKMVASRASRMLVCFEESAQYYRAPEKIEVVGMPVRKAFVTTTRQAAREALGIGDEPLVVSAFGSQGARAMNLLTAEMFALEQADGFPFRHIHAVGSYGWGWMPDKVKEHGVELENCPGIDMREYIYDMPTVMAAADVIIGRAGASSCNEIGVAGTPCILIPSPNVTNDHQLKNARVLERQEAAIVLEEADLTAQKLYDTVKELLGDFDRRKQMSARLRSLVLPDAAERICDIVISLAQKP